MAAHRSSLSVEFRLPYPLHLRCSPAVVLIAGSDSALVGETEEGEHAGEVLGIVNLVTDAGPMWHDVVRLGTALAH